jgi:catechol 2,3-dioxygenase-like lactoylglutathione lyase family enzyme
VPRVNGIAPFFLVADVTRAAEYYRDKLGFRIVGYFFEDSPVFAMVGRDERIIMLSLMERSCGGSNRDHKGEALDAYLWVDDVDALHAQLQRAGADIVTRRGCGFTA